MKVVKDVTGKGDQGVAWRVRQIDGIHGFDEKLKALRKIGGCCAWHGRTACNAEPVYVVMGGLNLMFSMYRECHEPGGLSMALACSRHFPDVKRDMPNALRRSQRAELLKTLEMLGADEDGTFVALTLAEIDAK